jgi:hypothetical protein
MTYAIWMPFNSKKTLAENLTILITHRYGEMNQGAFIRDSKIANGNVTRLLAGETSVGIDLLDRLARFFHVQPWVLLVPNINPTDLPNPVSKSEAEASAIALEALSKIAAATKG